MKIDLPAMLYESASKGDVKKLRKNGKIPAVLYGHGEKTKTIYVEHKEFKKVLAVLKKEAVTVNLTIENKNYPCLIKAIQHNPMSGELLHIDFQHIHKTEKIKATIPIHFLGKPPGIEKGGVVDAHLHEIVVRCLPEHIPSHIDIDVSGLDLGHTIHLRDIKLANVEFELTPGTPVISVTIPRVVEAPKPVVEEAVVAEGEAAPEEAAEGEEKGAKEKKEGKEGKEVKEKKETREAKETKEIKETKEPKR